MNLSLLKELKDLIITYILQEISISNLSGKHGNIVAQKKHNNSLASLIIKLRIRIHLLLL